MGIRHLNARQLGLICRYSIRHSLRSGSALVFMLLAVFFGLTVANSIISPFEAAVAQAGPAGMSPQAVEQNLVSFARPAVQWAIAPHESADPAAQRAAEERTRRWADYLLDERPALLSAIFLVLVFGMPLLIPFGAFNQTAGDIGNRGLRYLLLRTERANIFFGRLLATMAFTVVVQAVVIVTIALYLWLKVGVYGGGEIASWSLLGFVAIAVSGAPYVAVCAWISATRDSAMTSLVVANAVIGGVLLAPVLGAFAWEPARFATYLLPWGVQNDLLGPSAGTVAVAFGACVLYTVAFVWLGARTFERRDL
ncbi:MAG TPA: hypothetical protein VE907_05770 [Gammaproteobacteria bacterium]|nr:hypothetical protein [Gammaproteobacteria bacterium]